MNHTLPAWMNRGAGLLRSLAIYHGIPGRQRRLRTLYRHFVRSGDLAFDVGAHAGNRARALAALGCRVVLFEPQPAFASMLRYFGAPPEWTVVEAAVSAAPGSANLDVSYRTPTVTTQRSDWQRARAAESGFQHVVWNERITVAQTTLDAAIAQFGVPAFVKIDVEGAEFDVLTGVHQPLACLSFEYLPTTLEDVGRCLARLRELGTYELNWSVGETYRLAAEHWLDPDALVTALQSRAARQSSGDVYARLRR
ncbi:MAG: FkbM family methyltransferase [Vicinamibacterales bacterium]